MPSILVNRPEAKLLLCCASTSRSPEVASRIRALLREDIDWEYLLRAAHRHGIAPLLYWHLNASCPQAVPENVFDQLRNHFHTNNLRNLSLTGELLRLLKVFKRHGIPAIPYKGPVLAASVYGNLALRQFTDLDILVREQDILRATELLVSVGYRPAYPEHRMTRAQEAVLRRTNRTESVYVFTRDDGKSVVELHWAIIPRYFSVPLDFEGLWGRLEPISLGGETVLTFSSEDLLLILCVHGSKHLWGRFGWVCDIAELIRTCKGMNWKRVLEQATTLGSERKLLLGLFLANNLLGAVPPKEILPRVEADPMIKTLAGQVQEQLFWAANRSRKEEILFHLRVQERLQDKIRYCVHLSMPTSQDGAVVPLPGYFLPLYYLVRPIRLVKKYRPWRRRSPRCGPG